MPPFAAPAAVAGLTPAQTMVCHEKARFTYNQPCSNQWNHVLGFAPHSRSPDGLVVNFRPRPCIHRADHGWPPNTHEVCRYCIAAAEDTHWFKLATTHFRERPTARAEHNRSRNYLTRLCRLCEAREETLLTQLLGQAPLLVQTFPSAAQRRSMADWPRNRCICEKSGLYSRVRCLPHRKGRWDFVRPVFVEAKRHNREYLINTVRNALGRRVDSTTNQQATRVTNRLYRACRCGRDPVATIAEATVMQCLSCEGIVHMDIIPGGPQPAFGTLPPAWTPPELLQNSLTQPSKFTISGYWGINRRTND
jgi:hypothetical protein